VLLGAVEREGWLEREGCFDLNSQPQKRGENTDPIIQSQREQLWRVSRRVNSFSSRHPKTTNTIVSGHFSYNNVTSRLLGESNGYIPLLHLIHSRLQFVEVTLTCALSEKRFRGQ
jgi:hypothetical protein